jgi:L-alanine-DL-glutamate epimerase-like enolase superfamily enzyme
MDAKPKNLEVWTYEIPMRVRFEHARAGRNVSTGILVRLELADGSVGWGEGIPRDYVTGETIESATEVIRRISETEEEIIYVDLSKVARGEVPDFYMQPEDIVRVGTDQGAIYNAVNRNAYRATYGWGAVYDTNFSDYYPWRVDRHPLLGGLR